MTAAADRQPRGAPTDADEPGTGEATRAAFAGGGRVLGFRILQYAVGFGTSILIARSLGLAGRGQYALVLNMAMIVWIAVQLSIDGALGRLLARREATLGELTRLGVAAALILGPLGTLATIAIGFGLRDEALGGASHTSIVLAASTIPFSIAAQYFAILLFRIGALRPYGWTLVITAVAQLCLIAAVELVDGLSPESVLAVTLISVAGTSAGLGAALASRAGGIRSLAPTRDARLAGRAVRIAIRLHPDFLASFLMLKIDLLLVGVLTNIHQAGLYSLAASLADPLILALRSISAGAYEQQTKADERAAARFTVDFIRQSLAVSVVLGALVAAAAYPVITLAYGEEWRGAVLPFVILVGGIVFFALRAAADGLLLRIAPPGWVAWLGLSALAINVGLNLVLIPALGISGAALASLVTYSLSGVASVAILARLSGLPLGAAIALPRSGDMLFELPGLVRARLARPLRASRT